MPTTFQMHSRRSIHNIARVLGWSPVPCCDPKTHLPSREVEATLGGYTIHVGRFCRPCFWEPGCDENRFWVWAWAVTKEGAHCADATNIRFKDVAMNEAVKYVLTQLPAFETPSEMVGVLMTPQDYAYAEAVRLIPKQEPGQPPPGTVGGFLTQWYLARALAQFAGCYDAQDLIKRHISTMYAVTVDHEWVSAQAFKAIPSEKWGPQRQDSAMEQLMTVREIMSRLGFNSMAAGIDFLLLGD